jgi:hypothetical protein
VCALPRGSAEELAAALAQELALGRLPDAAAAARREQLTTKYGPAARFAPLLDWAADPRPAPDRADGVVRNPLADWQRRALRAGQREAALAELLDRLEGSRLVRLWLARQPRLRRLVDGLRR